MCCIQIVTFNTTSTSMSILHCSSQLLHVTKPRVCYITISSTNENMYVHHSIPQLVILIKSSPIKTEKFLPPTPCHVGPTLLSLGRMESQKIQTLHSKLYRNYDIIESTLHLDYCKVFKPLNGFNNSNNYLLL